MNRRQYLVSAGGALTALVGGSSVAYASRADIVASDLTRAQGEPAKLEKTITRGSVEYLEATNDVVKKGHTIPFTTWAKRASEEIGATAVLQVVDYRVDTTEAGVGSGVRSLLFGAVITVNHSIIKARDGSIRSEPNVPLDRLISVTPRTLTVSVHLAGRGYTQEIPVGVSHGTGQMLQSSISASQ